MSSILHWSSEPTRPASPKVSGMQDFYVPETTDKTHVIPIAPCSSSDVYDASQLTNNRRTGCSAINTSVGKNPEITDKPNMCVKVEDDHQSPKSAISESIPDMTHCGTTSKPLPNTYLPVESDHVQAILHQCGSYGRRYPIQTKLNQHKPFRESDPLLEKALMLTDMYDSHNIDILTRNHKSFHTETTDVTDSGPSQKPSGSFVASKLSCDSSCVKCKERIAVLPELLQSLSSTASLGCIPLSKEGPGFKASVVGASYVQNEGVIRNTGVTVNISCNLEKVVCEDKKGPISSGQNKNKLLIRNNIVDRRYAVETENINEKSREAKSDYIRVNSSEIDKNEKLSDDYLPIENRHLEAILENGQPFGIQYPIQTKLRSKFATFSEKRKIQQRRPHPHRVYLNRSQVRTIKSGVCSKSMNVQEQGNLPQHYKCSERKNANSTSHQRPINTPSRTNLLPQSSIPVKTHPCMHPNIIHQHEIYPKNLVRKKADKPFNLLFYTDTTNNNGHDIISKPQLPKSQPTSGLIGQRSSSPFGNTNLRRVKKRSFSATFQNAFKEKVFTQIYDTQGK